MNQRRRNQLIKKAKSNGHSNVDILRMQMIAERTAANMEKEASEKAFLDMLLVPVAVLANDYWPKSADKRMAAFIKEVVSLYESIQVGAVTREEIIENFEELTHMHLETTWRTFREENKDDG